MPFLIIKLAIQVSNAAPYQYQQFRTEKRRSIIKKLTSKSTHTHTHTFNSPFPGQPGKPVPNLNFTKERDSKWQWHQLGHVQVCTSFQTNNHASTPLRSFYRQDALPATQPTASKHWSTTMIRYDMRCYFNVRSKAEMSLLNLLHGNDNTK